MSEFAPTDPEIAVGPCCFCGAQIAPTATDPCRLTVAVASGLWQTWFCHATCFRARVVPGFDLEPAHF